LGKVGLQVETAVDGIECTDKVFSKGHGYFSVILVSWLCALTTFLNTCFTHSTMQCDLHMPRKDGYQTCREIRQWELKSNLPQLPMIALSANVMSDVVDQCIRAGFNSYVTKPVDFKELSNAMTDLLDSADPLRPLALHHV
jgi:CheY-like chemotaxis protein